jgi:hypothetical protein
MNNMSCRSTQMIDVKEETDWLRKLPRTEPD